MEGNIATQQPMSKRAAKRQLREEKNREQRMLKKQQKREEKRNNVDDEAYKEPDWERLPHEPLNAPRQERKAQLLESFASAKSSVTIAIDCAFEDKMTDSEKKSMAQQIVYAYASNKDAPVPVNLSIVGCQPLLEDRLRKMGAMTTWQPWGATVTTEPVEKAFNGKSMVYLSADSETILEELEEDTVYVIGGIVDRNRHKGLCASKAEALGIRTAKFPLDAYFAKAGFSRVLTTNHCVDILLEFACSRNWMQSCKRGVPIRKLKARKRKGGRSKDDAEEGTGGEDREESEEDVEEEDEEEEEKVGTEDKKDEGDLHQKPAQSQQKPKHAVVFGGGSGIGLALAEKLFSAGWSVLLADRLQEDLLKALKDIRSRHGEAGEIGFVKVDGASEGDVQRLKSIIFHRFERNIHAFVFNQLSGASEAEFLSKSVPVRELFRTWTGKDRVVPRFVLVSSTATTNEKSKEWVDTFAQRLPGRVQDIPEGIPPTELVKSAEWLNTKDH